jgi:hypothetical protein
MALFEDYNIIRMWNRFYPYRDSSGLSNVKILITLRYGKGCIWTEEFMAEDLGEEDIVGLVLGFEAVATDGAVG